MESKSAAQLQRRAGPSSVNGGAEHRELHTGATAQQETHARPSKTKEGSLVKPVGLTKAHIQMGHGIVQMCQMSPLEKPGQGDKPLSDSLQLHVTLHAGTPEGATISTPAQHTLPWRTRSRSGCSPASCHVHAQDGQSNAGRVHVHPSARCLPFRDRDRGHPGLSARRQRARRRHAVGVKGSSGLTPHSGYLPAPSAEKLYFQKYSKINGAASRGLKDHSHITSA